MQKMLAAEKSMEYPEPVKYTVFSGVFRSCGVPLVMQQITVFHI